MPKIKVKDDIIVEGPQGASLVANRCKSCGRLYFPKAKYCLDCLGEELEELLLKGEGKVFSYTVGRMPSTHFKPPYAVGFVDMTEGVRIWGPLDIVDNKPFQVGMQVQAYADTLWMDGENEYVGFRFRPI